LAVPFLRRRLLQLHRLCERSIFKSLNLSVHEYLCHVH
jgi:hypothetical protein